MNGTVYLASSFFLLLDGILMMNVMPDGFHFVIVAGCLYLPKIGVPLMTPLANRIGLFSLINICILAILLSGCLALLVGRHAYVIWGLLLVVQRFTLASWGFYDVIMADVIDEDRVVRNRPKSVATSIHGLQSLVVKPAQSLAQIVGLKLLMSHGLDKYHKIGSLRSEQEGIEAGIGVEEQENLKDIIFTLTFAAPLVISLLQWFVWHNFDLKGHKLAQIKSQLVHLTKKERQLPFSHYEK